jgi:hypothetical protein
MTVFAILIDKKTSCLLPGKELRQIGPKMRRFCISTTEIRERLWFKMRMELRQTTAAQVCANFVQLEVREVQVAETALMEKLSVPACAREPRGDSGLSVAEDPRGSR